MNIIIKNTILILALFGTLAACKKGNGPNPQSKNKARLTLLGGNSQSGAYGQDLADTIVLKVVPPAGMALNKYTVIYTMTQGNGLVEAYTPQYTNYNLINPDGTVKIKWRLGCNTPSQKLTISVYPDRLISFL